MTTKNTTNEETRELEPWSRELPPRSGWYFMRNEGETPLAEGMIVWVGHNRSGVRHEGEFFYSDHPFLQRREFLGPVTINVVNSHVALTDEVTRLREALGLFTDNGRCFVIYTNTATGDYFECLLCKREG